MTCAMRGKVDPKQRQSMSDVRLLCGAAICLLPGLTLVLYITACLETGTVDPRQRQAGKRCAPGGAPCLRAGAPGLFVHDRQVWLEYARSCCGLAWRVSHPCCASWDACTQEGHSYLRGITHRNEMLWSG
eukprot:1158773-Pelagomonas_calceolata.AAC.26